MYASPGLHHVSFRGSMLTTLLAALAFSSHSMPFSHVKNKKLEARSFHLLQDGGNISSTEWQRVIEAFSLPIPMSGESVG